MNQNLVKQARQLSQEFLDYVNKGVSPFHVCQETKNILLQNKFVELSEAENWNLQKGGKYFFTRNKSTIVAFTVGKKYDGNNTGFKIIGAHTDSPCLRLAPLSKLKQLDFIQTHVSTYGGGLWHTWFDRDLTLAGRVIFKNQNGQLDSTLFHHDKPLLKIPNICIHLQTIKEREAFGFNNEQHLRPVIAHEVYNQLSGVQYPENDENSTTLQNSHYRGLLNLISEQTKIDLDNIIDLDLYFVDTQKSDTFGLNQEYISSPRLDNLYSSYFALKSIVDDASLESSSYINMACLFDHEECGSDSFQGAHSNLLKQSMDRIFDLLASQGGNLQPDSKYKLYHNSFLISADMAHATHPNYQEKHKQDYKVKMNEGIVIKTNYNQSYTTDAVSATLLKVICNQQNIPTQPFIVKNDQRCGSTIGPLITSMTGIKGVDVGVAQLGMHSIRETCGVIDAYYYYTMFKQFYEKYESLDHNLLKY